MMSNTNFTAIAKSKKAMETEDNAAKIAKVLNNKEYRADIVARAKEIEKEDAVAAAAKAKKAADEKAAAVAEAVKAKKAAAGKKAKQAAEDDKADKLAMKTPENKTGL